ncbi:CBD9-like protein [Tilletiaria anomala UBC 951]|uniref:CBD9-like protein n=1 Tax=Tilletiaria anomala (strain ATCC 24038 / CBS 436.72 / UBC 951) TaxID=1037660 RepID=A0A066W5P9_TILAU|nr:CBD9-like protein [Tilletiaria anomala UBC 951]KDN46120.1 CBD9-like protein [Tilletiaria anomala UBC 951]
MQLAASARRLALFGVTTLLVCSTVLAERHHEHTSSTSAAAATPTTNSPAAAASSSSSQLTADTYINKEQGFVLQAIYDAAAQTTHFTLLSSKVGTSLGWLAIGTGSTMAGSNMMIGWVNADNSVTMSQRTANRNSDPSTTIGKLPAFQPDSAGSKSETNGTAFVWKLPASPSSSGSSTGSMKTVSFIWATSPQGPSSNSATSTIRQHTASGTFILDLTKAYMPTDAGSNSAAGSGAGGLAAPPAAQGASSTRQTVIIIHLLCAILAWLLLAPAGVLIGRFGRTTLSNWMFKHRAVQLAAVLFAVTAAALGAAAASVVPDSGGNSGWHGSVGYLVAGGALAQALLGQAGTMLFHARGIRALNYVHMPLGLSLVLLAVVNIGKGFTLWGYAPTWVPYALYAWAALCALAYIGGLVWGIPRERSRDRARQHAAAAGAAADVHSTPDIGMQSVDNLLAEQKHSDDKGEYVTQDALYSHSHPYQQQHRRNMSSVSRGAPIKRHQQQRSVPHNDGRDGEQIDRQPGYGYAQYMSRYDGP